MQHEDTKLAEDKEYLKETLMTPRWYEDEETVVTVARILNYWGTFSDAEEVIDYFEKPWKFERDMKFIVEEV